MSIQLRAWLMLTAVIATVQGLVALFAILQHDAVLSGLVRQRLSVLAQATAQAFQPIVDLGLPLSMMRNGSAIAARPHELDPAVRGVDVFFPTGIVVHSSHPDRPQAVPAEILTAMRLADGRAWSIEKADELDSGYTVLDRAGLPVGAVVVSYPKESLRAASTAMRWQLTGSALLLTAVFSALAYLLLRLTLATPQRALDRLERHLDAAVVTGGGGAAPRRQGLLATSIDELEVQLGAATARFAEARRLIRQAADDNEPAPPSTRPGPDQPASAAGRPTGSLAAEAARRLALPAGLLIVTAALLLGALALAAVNRSIEPELAARTSLIGSIVSENVERALSTGVPLESIVGAEAYFGTMLERLPEVAYVAVATGRILFEVGERIDPYLAPPRERKDVRSHPIVRDGKEIAYVVIDIDPAFVAGRFRDAFLDMGVIVLVTIFLAFELLVLLTSRSLTAGLDQLQRLATMQAAGDFSKRASARARHATGRMAHALGRRAELLHRELAEAVQRSRRAGRPTAMLGALEDRFGFRRSGPTPLRLTYFTDVRLGLFLFAAADQLPLSFLPLYTRVADNPWQWLDASLVISLPLAGYLSAIFVASPLSRSWAERLGHRRLLLLAAMPTAVAHLGLYAATSVPEIILWRTVTGFGYAIVSLTCQDYVIDTVSPDQRDRALGMFSAVLFGGIFCGTALGGVLADRLGAANVFLVSVSLIVVSAGLVAWLLPPATPSPSRARGRVGWPPLGAALRSRRFAALVLGIALPANLVLQAFVAYLVPVTLDAMGAAIADIGRILMLYFAAIALVGPLAGRAVEAGMTVPRAALAGALLSGAGMALAAAWPGQTTIVVAVIGAGIGHGMVRGAQVSLAMTMAETELAHVGPAATLGAPRTLERGGSVAGLIVIAGLTGTLGYATAAGIIAAAVLGGAMVFASSERLRGAAAH